MKSIEEITPIQQAINHIQENMNGIGIVMNESGLTAKEKNHYTTNYECLRITKDFLETLLPIEHEYTKQCCEEQKIQCAKNADLYFDESGFMDSYINPDCVYVDKDSILNTPNVVTTNQNEDN